MKIITMLSVAVLLAGAAVADDVKVQADREGVAVDVDRDATNDRTGTVERSANVMRMSELIGLNVRNKGNEELGEIEDVVVDLKSGEIRYAAISMGGFLGIGDKLFAVPFKAISFQTHRDDGVLVDSTERIAVVDVTKRSLENAQGFDQDNWPNMADRRWQQSNDRPYRIGTRPGVEGSRVER
jgi:sporulation protein YlmC with PRC-barrel domain